MARAHVLHVRDSSGIFGAERVILGVGRNLDRSLLHVSLLSLGDGQGRDEPLVRAWRSLGLPVFRVAVNGRLDRRALRDVRMVLENEGIDLVHSHDFKSNLYSWLASRHLKIPRVTTAHGSTKDSLKKRMYLLLDERLTYRHYQRIIAVSRDLRSQLLRRKVPESRIEVISNGLDLSSLDDSGMASVKEPPLSVPKDSWIFSVVGRLFPDKGHRFFLEALARLVPEFGDVFGLIVGDGPAKEEILAQARTTGVGRKVEACGVRSDMGTVYRHTNCLVISSLREGLPYVLLEAMASGVPVVATAVGDIPALVRDGETGVLVPPGDAAALADGMARVLRDPDRRARMVENARELVKRDYSAAAMARRTQAVYADLLGWKHDQDR